MQKKVEYYLIEDGELIPIDKDSDIVRNWKGHYAFMYDILKLEIYPRDLKLKPIKNFPEPRHARIRPPIVPIGKPPKKEQHQPPLLPGYEKSPFRYD